MQEASELPNLLLKPKWSSCWIIYEFRWLILFIVRDHIQFVLIILSS